MNKIVTASLLTIIMANGAYSMEAEIYAKSLRPTQQLSDRKMELKKKQDLLDQQLAEREAKIKEMREKMQRYDECKRQAMLNDEDLKKEVKSFLELIRTSQDQAISEDRVLRIMNGMRGEALLKAAANEDTKGLQELINYLGQNQNGEIGEFFAAIAQTLSIAQEKQNQQMIGVLQKAYQKSFDDVIKASNLRLENYNVKKEALQLLASRGDSEKVIMLLKDLEGAKARFPEEINFLQNMIDTAGSEEVRKALQVAIQTAKNMLNSSLLFESKKQYMNIREIEKMMVKIGISEATLLEVFEDLNGKGEIYNYLRINILRNVIMCGTEQEKKKAIEFAKQTKLLNDSELESEQINRVFHNGTEEQRKQLLFNAIKNWDLPLFEKFCRVLNTKNLQEVLKQAESDGKIAPQNCEPLRTEINSRLAMEERKNAPDEVKRLLMTGKKEERSKALQLAAKFSDFVRSSEKDKDFLEMHKEILVPKSLMQLVIDADTNSVNTEKIKFSDLSEVLKNMPECDDKNLLQQRINQRAKEMITIVIEQDTKAKSTNLRGKFLEVFVKANQEKVIKQLLDSLQEQKIAEEQFQAAIKASETKPNILRLLVQSQKTDRDTVEVLGLLDKKFKDERCAALKLAANSSRDDLMRLVIDADIKSKQKILFSDLQDVLENMQDGIARNLLQQSINQRAEELLKIILGNEPKGSESTQLRGKFLEAFVKANQEKVIKQLLDSLQGKKIAEGQFQAAIKASEGKQNIQQLLVDFKNKEVNEITPKEQLKEARDQLSQQLAMQQEQIQQMQGNVQQEQAAKGVPNVTESPEKVTEKVNPILAAQQDSLSGIKKGEVTLQMQSMPRTDQFLFDGLFKKQQQNYIVKYVAPELQQQKLEESLGIKLGEVPKQVSPQTVGQLQNNQHQELEGDKSQSQQASNQPEVKQQQAEVEQVQNVEGQHNANVQ